MILYYYDKNTLQFKQISLKIYLYLIFFIIVVFSSFSAKVASKITIEKTPIIIRYQETPFSEENLQKEIDKLNLKFKKIVYAQCIIEGASKNGNRWKNPIFIEGNNFLGLKKAYLRPSTAVSWNEYGYCRYNNWQDCLRDYALYQAQNLKNIKTDEEYLKFLDEMGYSINSNYTNLIKNIK